VRGPGEEMAYANGRQDAKKELMEKMLTFRGVITKVEERTKRVWTSGLGKEAVFHDVSDGWWLTLDDLTSYHVGQKPDFERGDAVIVRVEKVA
jgi:hypothetical protein